ncbi:MAG: 30S ribosomal protein S8 [Candidatus Saccharibacteria bacterium]|uniref:Small ribosomal subunit protein uS8 n=1 Tax=Candidatus Nanosyncoccus alces TaxID=2171997 RepID=A0ABY0FMT1_9BACT|nr:30S ribosomal protein S8 [Candidatus Nanosyncoccus alces]MBQ2643725.1 30S ribosomal protein S8 [Candidatus Saccharibacteria bacterium]MDO4399079.1 30S ribosomal protein S8 [Candidatus Saccharibacteria bacterium]RYC75175.1 30S ribosomal protein S8 [Candidatus Nanosyncoccus alces]
MSLQSTDQIADLITRIRNAVMVGKNEILVPTSKLKVQVIEVLAKNGYITGFEVIEGKPRGVLKVTINEPGMIAKINEISKVSKPGRRVYSAAEDLPVVKSGRGMVIVSTSKGLMTGREAKKNHLGGEILIRVW